jgi:signal transduction histidine kinase
MNISMKNPVFGWSALIVSLAASSFLAVANARLFPAGAGWAAPAGAGCALLGLGLALAFRPPWLPERAAKGPPPAEGERRNQEQEELAQTLRAAHATAVADLVAANRRKDEFLATLAHELRNPLAPIRTGAFILSMRPTQDEEIRQIHEMIARQSAHMARLVDDLLDVSRMEQGKVELRKERVDPGRVLAHAMEACKPLIEGRHHHLTLALAEPLPELEADPVRLEQILSNLIANACKCTAVGGEIRVSADREGAEVVLRIRDNGVGMEPEVIAHIFDLFYQAGQSLDRPGGGLGIGLTLARRLAQLHGGEITARSDGAGKGSEFLLRLPTLGPVPLGSKPAAAAPAAAVRPRHVLIVDDDSQVRLAAEILLRSAGYQVTLAGSGAQGIECALRLRPDIALVDLGMPGLNGLEVASRIRSELGRQIRLVALTGYSRQSDIAMTAAAGFDQHLVKSGDPQELLDLLGTLS